MQIKQTHGVSFEKNDMGFSLIELIITLSLIALILGITIVRMGGAADQRKIETVRGDLRMFQMAVNAYYLNHKSGGNYTYPGGADWQSNDLTNDNPRVLRQILYDPFQSNGGEYHFFVSASGKYYVISSDGPDRQSDITGINDSGRLTGSSDDDIFVTSGSGLFTS